MRWIGTAFLVLVVAGFVWSLLDDLFAYISSGRTAEECPTSDEVFDKK